jgi:hypothetical protein
MNKGMYLEKKFPYIISVTVLQWLKLSTGSALAPAE